MGCCSSCLEFYGIYKGYQKIPDDRKNKPKVVVSFSIDLTKYNKSPRAMDELYETNESNILGEGAFSAVKRGKNKV